MCMCMCVVDVDINLDVASRNYPKQRCLGASSSSLSLRLPRSHRCRSLGHFFVLIVPWMFALPTLIVRAPVVCRSPPPSPAPIFCSLSKPSSLPCCYSLLRRACFQYLYLFLKMSDHAIASAEWTVFNFLLHPLFPC